MSADLLQTIVAAARRAAEFRAAHVEAEPAPEGRRPNGAMFEANLRREGIRVIAECKRRSPSRGVLRRDYDPVAIAREYERAGAAAISVLTEPTFFGGSLNDLRAVREAVGLPLLRKDFIVTEFQIDEAVAAGADAVLLIVGALDGRTLERLLAHSRLAGLATLVEVHDRGELEVAIRCGATLIGVNSRNLRTLEVDPTVFDALAPLIPREVLAVAESGLRNAADLTRLRRLRYNAFLVGERFMTEPSPGGALEALRRSADEVRA